MDRIIQYPHSGRVEMVSEDEARDRPLIPDRVPAEELPNDITENANEPTVEAAIERLSASEQHLINNDDQKYTSRYETDRHRWYPRILGSDRHFQEEYELTTAILTRRFDPLDDSGQLLTPWEMSDQLHGQRRIHESIRGAVNHQMGSREWERIGVTTPNSMSGAPEELLLYWIDDPGDEVDTGFFTNALHRHIEYCPGATEENHPVREDGTGWAIQVDTDPEILAEDPEEISPVIFDNTDLFYPTRMALAVARRLPYLPIGDWFSEDDDNPNGREIEGAVSAWITPHHWRRPTNGLPTSEELWGE